MADPLFISPMVCRDPVLIAGFGTRHLSGNLDILSTALGSHPSHFVSLKQVHSNRAIEAKEDGIEGDALVTQATNQFLCVKTADCVPLLVHDPVHKAIAAIHAGWRGLAAGIIENTLNLLRKNYDSHAGDLKIAIGPAICQPCFEIGPEVAERFQKKFQDKAPLERGEGDRFHLDLIEGCKRVLKQAGTQNSHIETIGLCTACRTDLLYSYRKEGPQTGRLIAFIGLVTPPKLPLI